MNTRVQGLRERVISHSFRGTEFADKRVYLDAERARYWTESYRQTDGEPEVIRRAKALKNLLEKMTIYIADDELIIGNESKDPCAVPPTVELSDESNREMIEDGYVKKEELAEFESYMAYWKPRNMWSRVKETGKLPEPYLFAANSLFLAETGTARDGISSNQPDMDFVLTNGWGKILKRIETKIAEERKSLFVGSTIAETVSRLDQWEAMKIAVEGYMNWHQRYAFLAREVSKQETDSRRKKELEQIAHNLEHLATEPPESFWQAVQETWLVQIVTHQLERLALGTSTRIDQFLYPFYEKDKKAGKLTWDDAMELIECLWIKVSLTGRPSTRPFRVAAQGLALLQIYTLGGVKPDGSDACNDLTKICMQASRDARTMQPSYCLRVHSKIRDEYMLEGLENLKTGIAMPSFENDSVVIPMLMNDFGATLEQARNWALILCKSPGPVGPVGTARRRPFNTNATGSLTMALYDGVYPGPVKSMIGRDMGPHTGDPRQWKSMDDVYEAYRKQYYSQLKLGYIIRNICHEVEAKYFQQPFLSACFEPCIEKGKDCMEHDELPVPWFNITGLVDTADAFAAMKYWIFEGRNGSGRKYTMDQLLKAMDKNWEGYEEMRQDFLLRAPKFGNDDDYADAEFVKALDIPTEEGLKFTDKWGAHPRPLPQALTTFRQIGKITPALPNGRKAGEVLYDGGSSPGYGCDTKGPTAVLKSCSKYDYTKVKGCLLNQRMSPATVEGEKGKQVFLSYMKAWHDLGVEHVQINMVDSDVLRAAQREPEKYSDLIVRVAGYSAYFIELDKETQDSIVARTAQDLVAVA